MEKPDNPYKSRLGDSSGAPLISRDWMFGVVFGLHFAALGLAWIPLMTKLRELFGQQTAAMCASGPSIAAILTLGMFLAIELKWPWIRRQLWCGVAEALMGAGYLILYGLLVASTGSWTLDASDFNSAILLHDGLQDGLQEGLHDGPAVAETIATGVAIWYLIPLFVFIGLCQSSVLALLSSMIVASSSPGRFLKYRAAGSLGYAIVAITMGEYFPPYFGLWMGFLVAVIGVIACQFLPNVVVLKPTATNTETVIHSSRWTRQLPILLPLLMMLFLTGTSEQFHQLYAHQFATLQFGSNATIWIGYAVFLEIVVLLIYPERQDGWRTLLIMVQPIAWMIFYFSCTVGVEYSPWFAYAIIFQGFNCGGVAMVQQRVGKVLSNVSAQASVLCAQGAGWLLANGLDAFVLGKGTPVVWRVAFQFACAATCVAIFATTMNLYRAYHHRRHR